MNHWVIWQFKDAVCNRMARWADERGGAAYGVAEGQDMETYPSL